MNSSQTMQSKASLMTFDHQSGCLNVDQISTVNACITPVQSTIKKLEEEHAKMSEYIKDLEQKSILWKVENISMKEKLNQQKVLSRNLEIELIEKEYEVHKAMNQNSSMINQKKSMQEKEMSIIKDHLEHQRALTIELEAKNKLLEEKLHETRSALNHEDTFKNKKLREELFEAQQALDLNLSVREQIRKRKRKLNVVSNAKKLMVNIAKKIMMHSVEASAFVILISLNCFLIYSHGNTLSNLNGAVPIDCLNTIKEMKNRLEELENVLAVEKFENKQLQNEKMEFETKNQELNSENLELISDLAAKDEMLLKVETFTREVIEKTGLLSKRLLALGDENDNNVSKKAITYEIMKEDFSFIHQMKDIFDL